MLKDYYETKESRRRKIRKEQGEIYGYEMKEEWCYYEDDGIYAVVSGEKVG